MIKKFFKVKEHDYTISAALLIARLTIGIAFMYHGWGKIQSPLSWMPAEAPIKIPAVFQFLAAFSEFGGGLALVLGLFYPLTNLGIGFTMLTATYLHMIILKDPFVNSKGGSYELAIVYLVLANLFYILGPGKLSLDKVIFGTKNNGK